jgi:hypothetical protein
VVTGLTGRKVTSSGEREPQASGDVASDGVVSMSGVAKLLARKHELVERLHEDPDPEERDQIEHQLEQINAVLNSLEDAPRRAS